MAEEEIAPVVPVVAPVTPPPVTPPPVTAPPVVDEWKPPTKAEHEALQAKLAAVNAESAGRRVELTALKQKNETDGEKAKREAAEEAARIRDEALAEATKIYKPTAIRASAKTALLEADAKQDRVAALAGLLNTANLDINDKGEIAGLDAEVKRVKAEYPEFFKVEGEKPRPGKLAAGGKQPAEESQAPWDILAARHGG